VVAESPPQDGQDSRIRGSTRPDGPVGDVRPHLRGIGGSIAGSRILKNRLLAYLGKISYSVYLTHMLVLYPVLYVISAWGPVPAVQAAVMLTLVPLGTIALSSATFTWIERPGIRAGSRFVGTH
jgi:peptidoglycan/LPS O-acetylase OafA/YrhL